MTQARTFCVDIGSTWTKGALVAGDGTLLGTTQRPTSRPDVLRSLDEVGATLGGLDAPTLACSSAGGGLRLAVIGQERLVSAEAGYRVALSSGAAVVHVAAGALTDDDLDAGYDAAPDILLLAGGTDGGDESVLLHNAGRLAERPPPCPVVLAGNAEAADAARELLTSGGCTVAVAGNVLPDVGELAPDSARRAIRRAFLDHVIGHKGLSQDGRLRRLVHTVTPDAVRTAVARLATVLADGDEPGSVLVVDVGGATTDVYSVATGDDAPAHVVGLPADRRTVEGDLGMRLSAPTLVAEALARRLIEPAEAAGLAEHADVLARQPDRVPEESTVDHRLAGLACVLAVRRHLGLVGGSLGPHGARLLVLSGGVFRHAGAGGLAAILPGLYADPALRPILRTARAVVDERYVLAPAGLLAASDPAAADALLRTYLTCAGPAAESVP